MRSDDILASLTNYQPHILGYDQYNKYSLLLPIIDKENESHLLFEVRSFTMRSQPGDVCFPGGRVDPDDQTVLHSALRETEEEIGIQACHIERIQALDYIVSDFGSIIYPFVGKLTSLEALCLNETEVAEVFTVPLRYFMEVEPEKYQISYEIVPEKDFPFHLIQGGENYNWRTRLQDELFYQYDGRIIWGLTARIVYHLVHLLKARIKTK